MIPNFISSQNHKEIRVRFLSKLFCKSEDYSQQFLYQSIRNNLLNTNLPISYENFGKNS